jgi:hypothetical protein
MMIPIPFTAEQDAEVVYEVMGIRRWRKVLDIDLFDRQPSIGVTMQLQHGDQPWRDLHSSGFSVSLAWPWEWSEEHFWYDGPHCLWSRGFLRFFRGGNMECEKCCGRDDQQGAKP